ncbi:MAG: carbon-monoxide dehydrogenase large subunit [Acidimicrobiia bacterium]|nr:MAG: carbon-monoxide dehydrogenase large subunit [Acidimicrobiia bacterium]
MTELQGSILGAAVKRREDPRLITGAGTYITDMKLDGALWAAFVRSTLPHGLIRSVDTEPAQDMPGVVAVYVAGDLDVDPLPIDYPNQPEVTRRPLIASDRVRFVGDIVAMVVAESEPAAHEAAAAVWPEIDPIPAVADPEAALAEDAPLLYPEHGSNLVAQGGSDTDGDPLADAEVVVEGRVVHQRLAALPLEPNACVAVPRGEELELWVASQNVFSHRNAIATALKIDRNRLHVKVPDMGGGFGAKIAVYPEQALVAAAALRLGRPVRWHETRTENLLAMNHGRGQTHSFRIGARRDGTITGLDVEVLQDAGAYPLFGAYLPAFTQRMASGPYRIPRIRFRWRSVVTNTTPVHAYRGAGRPEAALTLERAIEMLAAELGIDSIELRRRNFITSFPHRTATGERYDTGDYPAALDLALTLSGYENLRRDQEERRVRGDRLQLGIGISTYVEVTAPAGRKDWGAVEVADDGTVTAYSGSSSHGQGHETTFAQIVSAVLGVPLERIRVVQGDSDRVARGGGTMGSRSMQMGGSAVLRSARAVMDKARAILAHLMEADPADVVPAADGLMVAGVPETQTTWGELARLAADPSNLPEGMEPGLRCEDHYAQDEATVPFGAHVCVVEVDTETGDVRVLRHVACDDCGVIFNRMVVDGQVHGGAAQGIGQALYEQVRYDSDGNPLTTNLTSYLLPTASVLPSFEVAHTQTPTTENPLGAKGIGESATIGSTPAVVNAVCDALAPLGVRHLDMPITPERVWRATHTRRA